MKKTILLLSIGLLLLAGCSTENADNRIEQQKGELVFVYNLVGDSPIWEAIYREEIKSNQSSSFDLGSFANKGNSVHAHGNFAFGEFSGTENNGGAHGSATMNLGPFVLSLETECVMVDGNEAVYGGIVTEMSGPPGPDFIGAHIYFKVIDNGQGSNAAPDQFAGVIQFKMPGDSQCGIFVPSHPSWVGPTFDISAPGKVKVNN